jgi:DNA-binding NtrC family response regulator
MNKEEVLKIIGMIADGLDPYGENDPDKLPENNPITMRAICTALMSLLSHQEKQRFKLEYEPKTAIGYSEEGTGPFKKYLVKEEADLIRDALIKTNFDDEATARQVGIDLSKVREKTHLLGLSPLALVTEYIEKHQPTGMSLDEYLNSIESQIILEAIQLSNSKKSKAANLLGITFRSLRYRIEKLKLNDRPLSETINYLPYLKDTSLDFLLQDTEKRIVLAALEISNKKKTKAANFLGVTVRILRYRLKAHDIASEL